MKENNNVKKLIQIKIDCNEIDATIPKFKLESDLKFFILKNSNIKDVIKAKIKE